MEIPELLGNICCVGKLLIFRCKVLQRKTRLTYFFVDLSAIILANILFTKKKNKIKQSNNNNNNITTPLRAPEILKMPSWNSIILKYSFAFNPIQDGSFRGCSRMREVKMTPPPSSLKFVTHPTLIKVGTVIHYLNEILKTHK